MSTVDQVKKMLPTEDELELIKNDIIDSVYSNTDPDAGDKSIQNEEVQNNTNELSNYGVFDYLYPNPDYDYEDEPIQNKDPQEKARTILESDIVGNIFDNLHYRC